jgi:outer membrane PBP1 activator LpoA protein
VSTKRPKAHQDADERTVGKDAQQARTYESAIAERNAKLDAIRERTERLKALRLAHEARIQQHLRSVRSAPKKSAKTRAKQPEKKITLAEWLAQQRAFGRDT